MCETLRSNVEHIIEEWRSHSEMYSTYRARRTPWVASLLTMSSRTSVPSVRSDMCSSLFNKSSDQNRLIDNPHPTKFVKNDLLQSITNSLRSLICSTTPLRSVVSQMETDCVLEIDDLWIVTIESVSEANAWIPQSLTETKRELVSAEWSNHDFAVSRFALPRRNGE